MRVGIVIEHFTPRRGGAEKWTYQFAAGLVRRGHEVHVVAQDFEPDEPLPIAAHALGRIRSRVGRAAAAEKALRRIPLDLIHDMGMGWHCDLFHSHDGSRLAQLEQRLRTVPDWLRPWKRLAMRVLPRYREFRRLIARQLADRGQIVMALSRKVADDFIACHKLRPEQLRVIYNGVDTERFSPRWRSEHRHAVRARLGISESEVVFLFVGHDFRRKGLAPAVRAVRRLKGEGLPVRLLVVGGGRYGRSATGPGGPSDLAVVQVGSVDDTVPYYAAADAYVLPTFYDPCSLGVLEAVACGLPAVTTRQNGAGELLTEGLEGFILADPADDAALADRLRILLDPSLRTQMGQRARELALRNTMERNCDQIVALYGEILTARQAGARRAA